MIALHATSTNHGSLYFSINCPQKFIGWHSMVIVMAQAERWNFRCGVVDSDSNRTCSWSHDRIHCVLSTPWLRFVLHLTRWKSSFCYFFSWFSARDATGSSRMTMVSNVIALYVYHPRSKPHLFYKSDMIWRRTKAMLAGQRVWQALSLILWWKQELWV